MIEPEEDIEEELRLAQQMKKYCDVSGRETNPAKAADIIHQIGKIYRKRSPDKVSLVKCTGLFNAAIVRLPCNVDQIESDLSEVCLHVLQLAKAKTQSADLIKKANCLKTSINELRNKVNNFLQISLPKIIGNTEKSKFQQLMENKISAVQRINEIIADQYKHIMAELAQFCEDVMGNPPCEYAVVGMGSLARKEITPYSDFEHIILLCNDKNYQLHLEYFRWFSVIFHVVVLNIQETIIPSLNVCSLNDKNSEEQNTWYYDAITPRGISFDGMMPHACKFPLGRQTLTENKRFTCELIKPVDQMLQYLSSDADLKNGYHLSDILTKTCFVFGNKTIFKTFVNGAQCHEDQKSSEEIIDNIQTQIKDDLNKFSTRFRLSQLKSQNKINIKQLVYRSCTIFVAALARIHHISANSCFDVINEMEKNKKITKHTAFKLKCAIAIACEMRLRVYMKKQSQFDEAIDLKQSDGMESFLDIVGLASTINYFQIAYCLQCEVAKQLKLTKLHFYSNSETINITICLALQIQNLTNVDKISNDTIWNSAEFDFDASINTLEKGMSNYEPAAKLQNQKLQTITKIFKLVKLQTPRKRNLDLNAEQIKTIADKLYSARMYDEALEFYEQQLSKYQRQCNVKAMFSNQTTASSNQNNQSKALKYFQQTTKKAQTISLKSERKRNIATTLYHIGHCHTQLQNFDKALKNLNRALQVFQNTTLNSDKDAYIATTLHEIGRCHTNLQNYDEALKNLNRALQIKQNTTLNSDKDRSIAITLREIGRCHRDLQNYDEALKNLNRSLQIYQNTTLNSDKDRCIAATLYELGGCHTNLQNYDEALKNLNRSLQIKQNTTLNSDKDRNIGITLHEIGCCHAYVQNYDEALKNLNRALQIKQNTTLNSDKDRNIAATLHELGSCHTNLQNYDEALKNLNRSLQIYQKTTLNSDKDTNIAATLHEIDRCHTNLQNYDEALKNLN